MLDRKTVLRLLMIVFINMAGAALWAETSCSASNEACGDYCGGACCAGSCDSGGSLHLLLLTDASAF